MPKQNKQQNSKIWIDILSVTSSIFTIIGISILGVKGSLKVSGQEVISIIFCCISSICLLTIFTLITISYLNNQAFFWELPYGRHFFWAVLIISVLIYSAILGFLDWKWVFKMMVNGFN